MQKLTVSHGFDLVHQLNPVFTGISLCLVGSGLPLVLGTYVARWPIDPDAFGARGRWGSVVQRGRDRIAGAQQRRADALVLTTPAAWNRLPDPEAVRNRIHVIPHGVDTELFSPYPGWESPENLEAEQRRPSILFLANVVKRKGILTLIAAFVAVLREFHECKLRVAGSGSDLAEAKQFALAPGLRGSRGISGPSGTLQRPEPLSQMQRLLSAFIRRTLRKHRDRGHGLRQVSGGDRLRSASLLSAPERRHARAGGRPRGAVTSFDLAAATSAGTNGNGTLQPQTG